MQSEFRSNDLQPTAAPGMDATTSANAGVQRSEGLASCEQALLTDADMPDIETLTASSDISGFLGKGVSAALRKAALRHVFRQPKYNLRDGLDDYDDDYTTFEPLGDTVTSDMKFHAARKERASLASERLAEEPIQTELDTTHVDTAKDSTSTLENEQSDKPVDEEFDAGKQETPDDDQERHENMVAMAEDDAMEDAHLSRALLPDQRPDTDKPLKKTSQATASQTNEIPNE